MDCISALDSLVAELGARDVTGANAIPVEKLQPLAAAEKRLVAALQEYQELIAQIAKIMETMAPAAAAQDRRPDESAEYRFLMFLRQRMIAFLTENRKLITHYKMLQQNLQGPEQKPAAASSVSSVQAAPVAAPAQAMATSSMSVRPTSPAPSAAPVQIARPKSPPPPYRPSAGK